MHLRSPIYVPPEQRLDVVPNVGLRVARYVRRGTDLSEDYRVHFIRRVRVPRGGRVRPMHCPRWELHGPPVGHVLPEAFSLTEAPGKVILSEYVPVLQVLRNPHILAHRPEFVWHDIAENSCC